MQLKNLGVKGLDNFDMIKSVIKGLSDEQAATVLSTTALSTAQKAAALAANGMSDEDIVATMVKKEWCKTQLEANNILEADEFLKLKDAASTDLLTAAYLRLEAAAKGLWATIKAHSVITGVAIAGAVIAGIIAAYKRWGPTQENLAKWLDESKQKVQESTQNIEEMESELEKVQSRISELQEMGSLTIVQQKELSNLEKSNKQLERSIELEKTKRRIANKKATSDFVKWFDKDMKSDGEYKYTLPGGVDAVKGFWKQLGLHGIVSEANKKGAAIAIQSTDEMGYANLQFDLIDSLITQRESAATADAKKEIDGSIDEIFEYLSDKSTEFNEKTKDIDLEYTPNAKNGTQEAKVNDIIEYIDTFNDKLLLAQAKADPANFNYNTIFDSVLSSTRFDEATEKIEKLKISEDGTAKSSEDFQKDLYNLFKEAGKADGNNNIKQLTEYLTELGLIDLEKSEDGITDLAKALVEATEETNKAVKSNLLFADSYSKITTARKKFEEDLQNVESGTEDFESYADSYTEAMKLLNQGYDLDNGVLMAHVERLISEKQLKKLGYDADKVKAYLQKHLKGVFGDKDTLGKGFVDKIKKSADSDGKIYAKDKNGEIDYSRELASYDNGMWHFSDNEKDIAALGKQFGMTTEEILACVKALNTYSEVDLNDTDTIIDKLKGDGKAFSFEELSGKTAAPNGAAEYLYNKLSAVEHSEVLLVRRIYLLIDLVSLVVYSLVFFVRLVYLVDLDQLFGFVNILDNAETCRDNDCRSDSADILR